MMQMSLSSTAGAALAPRHLTESAMHAELSEATCRRLTQHHGEFNRLRVVTFPIFLTAAILKRVLMQRRQANAYTSIIHDAKAMADSALPFAYMG
jgi:hypothetical protein